MYHLRQNFAELKLTIDAFPEELWARPIKEGWEFLNPSILAHHCLGGMCGAWFSEEIADQFPDKYKGHGKTQLSKDEVYEMLEGVQKIFLDGYSSYSDEEYLSKVDAKGRSIANRMLFQVGHFRYHLGQLTQILRDNGIEEPEYFPLTE